MAKRTTEQFIIDARITHGNRYEYDNSMYTGKGDKLTITCKIHGDFEQEANSHIRGGNCPKCAKIKSIRKRTKTTVEFIKEVSEVHNYRYTYENAVYKGSLDKIKVNCKLHGVFEPIASNHLRGTGCPVCSRIQISHWGRTKWIEKANGRICTFYTLRCFNETEEFYKIGITMRTTKDRYPGVTTMPYNYEIISEIQGEAGIILDLELVEKRKLREFNYQPKIEFNGAMSECFTKYKI